MIDRDTSLLATACLAAALVLAFGGAPAAAQSAAAPSGSSTAQPHATALESDSLDSELAAWSDAPAAVGPEGPPVAPGGVTASREIHGEVGAAVGSGGYRAGYVTTQIPIGADATMAVGVSESQSRFRGGPSVRNQALDLGLSVGETGRPCNGSRNVDAMAPAPYGAGRLDAAGPGGPACN